MYQHHYMTFSEFQRIFGDEESCLDYLFCKQERSCKLCKSKKFYLQRSTQHYVCFCGKFQVSPRIGTIFKNSKVPLTKWFYAVFLFSSTKNGIAAMEMKRTLGVSYPTAHRMCTLIRKAMREYPELQGEVEVDEAVFGGRRRGKRGRGAAGKTIMFGAVERGGKCYAAVVPSVESMDLGKHFLAFEEGTTLITDGLPAYKGLTKMFDLKHESVDHWKKEYVRGNVHTNSIESFWAQIKRSLHGTHHSVSSKYLNIYIGEYVWKFNRRHEKDLFRPLLALCSSKKPHEEDKPLDPSRSLILNKLQRD